MPAASRDFIECLSSWFSGSWHRFRSNNTRNPAQNLPIEANTAAMEDLVASSRPKIQESMWDKIRAFFGYKDPLREEIPINDFSSERKATKSNDDFMERAEDFLRGLPLPQPDGIEYEAAFIAERGEDYVQGDIGSEVGSAPHASEDEGYGDDEHHNAESCNGDDKAYIAKSEKLHDKVKVKSKLTRILPVLRSCRGHTSNKLGSKWGW
jgi:hypothetical protein